MIRMFKSAPSAVFLVVSAMMACAEQEATHEFVVRRDSAGVAIVETAVAAWDASEGWRLASAPVVDLSRSGTGEAHEFFRVRDMRQLSNGVIAVANGGTNELRLFSIAGSFLRATGGSGDGPGEYRNLRMLENAGDTLIVLDSDGRVTLLGPELDVVETFDLRFRAVSVHHLGGGEVGVQFVSPSMISQQASGALIRNPGVLYRLSNTGRMIDSVTSTPGTEEYIHVTADGGRTASRPLFGKSSHVTTWNGRIYRGSADDMQVEELSGLGEVVRILRIRDYPLTLTDAVVRAERNSYLYQDLPRGMTELPPFLRRLVEELPTPDRRPAYSGLHIDPMGAIWLRPFVGRSEAGANENWQVIADDGSWLGEVEIPANFMVMSIETDVVLGVFTDDSGVERPRVLRLNRH